MHKTIILPVVLYGFETQSFTLRVELRQRVFENMIMIQIVLDPKKIEKGRRLQNEELHIV